MSFYSKENIKTAATIGSRPGMNGLSFYGDKGDPKIFLGAEQERSVLFISDKNGKPATVLQGKSGDNSLEVYGDLGVSYRYTGKG